MTRKKGKPVPLQYDTTYHIYNRGINRGNLFFEDRNYRHFLRLYADKIEPVAETFAYCLLPNTFICWCGLRGRGSRVREVQT